MFTNNKNIKNICGKYELNTKKESDIIKKQQIRNERGGERMEDNKMLNKIYNELCGLKDDFSEMKGQLTEVQSQVTEVQSRVTEVQSRVTGVESQVTGVQDQVMGLQGRIDNLEEEVKEVREDIHDIRITLENVTNRNVSIVAEGHLDLSRKLDEAIGISKESEIYKIKVNILEDEIRRLKERSGFPI